MVPFERQQMFLELVLLDYNITFNSAVTKLVYREEQVKQQVIILKFCSHF